MAEPSRSRKAEGLGFGELLDWHLLNGTRPRGVSQQGRAWGKAEFAGKIGVSDRQLRYWLNNEKLPNEIESIERELFGPDQTHARDDRLELREAYRRTKFGAAPGDGAAKPLAESNIPIRVPDHFLGRDDALAAVDAALKRHEGRVAITAVHGLRGVGKTTLAYAERHARDYRATWWVRAQSADSMRADLVALGVRLGWVLPDEKEAPAYEKVAERLRRKGDGLLLIYDNAIDGDSLRPFLPKGGAARVLITSNFHVWGRDAKPIKLKPWRKEIGADYFVARLGRENERADAEALSEALGGLPLAHEQAAAYCERLGVSLSDYRRRFDTQPIKLLDAEKDAPAEYHDRLTVAKTFALAIEEAAKLHPAAEPLIVHAALLAPEPIPLFLFEDGREALGEPLASALAGDGLEEALAALRAFALVDLEMVADERDAAVETKCFRLHRLVRAVAAGRCEGGAREEVWAELVGAMVAAMEASGQPQDARSWPRLRRLTNLATALATQHSPSAELDWPLGYILAQLAIFYQALGDYIRATPLSHAALTIHETIFGPHHPQTASSINNVATLLQAQDNLEGARPLFERALAINENAYGPEHPETAVCIHNLAVLLRAQGDLDKTRLYFERVVAIYDTNFGTDHPHLAIALDNLARTSRAQGDLTTAHSLFERAVSAHQEVFGRDHPDTAKCQNNFALLLEERGNIDRAQALVQEALATYEKHCGPEHQDVATTL